MSWRRLRAGELDHEAVWFGVSLGAAAIAATWLALDLPRPLCPLHAATGIPCPGCGTTRALHAMLAGGWRDAFFLNPLACATLSAVAIFDAYAATVLIARLPRWRPAGRLPMSARIGAVAALGLNWAWLLWQEWR